MSRWVFLFMTLLLVEGLKQTSESDKQPLEEAKEEKPAEWIHDDDIYILEPWVVDKFKAQFLNVMILFYGKGCGNCQWMMGEYRKAAKTAKQKKLGMKFAMMNGIANRDFTKNLGVNGFPHIHVFGEMIPTGYQYKGKMVVSEFIKELMQHAEGRFKPAPRQTVELTDKNFAAWTEQDRSLVIFTHTGDDNLILPFIDETIVNMKEAGEELILPVGVLNTTVYKGLAPAEDVTKGTVVYRKGVAFDFWVQSNIRELKEELVNRYYSDSISQELTMDNVEENEKLRGEFFEGTGTENILIFAAAGQDYKSEIVQKWLRQCYKNDDMRCGHTFDRALIKKYKMKNYHLMWNRPSVWPLKSNQKPTTILPKKPIKVDAGFMDVWSDHIKDVLLPLVIPYDVEGYRNRAHWGTMAVVVAYFNINFGTDQRRIVKQLAKVARKYDGLKHDKAPVQFAIADEIANHDFLYKFGLHGRELEDDPVIVIHDCYNHTDHAPNADEQYLKNSKFEDYVTTVVDRYLQNEIPPLTMSEPVPKHQTSSITTLVRETFNATVTDPKKDVVVFMTLDNCPECDKIEKWLEDIADQIEAMEEPCIVTKINMDKNTLPRDPWTFQSGPRLYMVPGGSRNETVEWFPGYMDMNPPLIKQFMGQTAKLSFKNCHAPKKETFKNVVGVNDELKSKDEL